MKICTCGYNADIICVNINRVVDYNAEMETHMLGNILLTRCMVLECINLEMDIVMKEPGMKEESRDLVHTLSEMGKHNLVTGKMGFLILACKIAILDLPMLSTMPKF